MEMRRRKINAAECDRRERKQSAFVFTIFELLFIIFIYHSCSNLLEIMTNKPRDRTMNGV